MNHIKDIREKVGKIPLILCAAGVLILDQNNKILLMKRSDDHNWCIPGGLMELGETVEETAKREVLEETNLSIEEMTFFKLYSGKQQHHTYPNGDEVYFVNAIFTSRNYTGEIKTDGFESSEIQFFSLAALPENISPVNKPFIDDLRSNLFTKESRPLWCPV